MHILVLATDYPPRPMGIGNVAHNVVQHLERMGHRCTVCSPSGPDIVLGSYDLIGRTGIGGLLHFWLEVSRHFKDGDYDAAWLHEPLFLGPVPFKNSVFTIHSTYRGEYASRMGSPVLQLYKRLSSMVEGYCLRRLRAPSSFTAVDPAVCRELVGIGIAGDRVTYIPNGVNTRQFFPSPDKKLERKKFGIPEDDIILLSVGRLTPAKQPLTLIEVFSHLEKELGDVTLAIAGTGTLLDQVKHQVRSRGLTRVKILGYVEHKSLPSLYAAADYYIMVSRYEGQPLTLLEAMASGLPCIVSDIPNLRLVRDASCGITINLEDTAKAAEAITTYIQGDTSADAVRAREYIQRYYDWEIIAKKYLNLLEGVSVSK